MAGIPSGIIRFILHTPLGVWSFSSLDNYYLVRDNPQLQSELYNPMILPAMRMAGAGVRR